MKQWLVRSGVLATVPVASLVLAFGACSSQTGSSDSNEVTQPPTTAAVDTGREVEESPFAAHRIARHTSQFVHLPPVRRQPLVAKRPAGALPPKPEPAEPQLEARAVLSKGDASRFLRQGVRLRAEVSEGLKASVIKSATTDVPTHADGFTRVQPDGGKLGVEFATKNARPGVEAEVADGTAIYPAGAADGGDIILRVTAGSVEDFVVLNQKPAEPHVDYTVKVNEVAGLRLYDNTLEFLDKGGDPLVRVKPPHLVDVDGVSHPARLEVRDCAADRDGRAPWGRPVTGPGATECTVRVSWDDTKVIYPAIVDPVWATAGSLATERWKNGAVRLATGFVLTCGGEDKNGVPIKSCESFNPAGAAGAGTWAATTAMNFARSSFALVSLSPASNDVVAVGGGTRVDSERFDGVTWTTSGGDFSAGYFQPQALPAVTSDGQYLVVIDYDGTPFRLPTATNTWNAGTTNPAPLQPYRYSAHIVGIPGQATILRAAGYYSGYFADAERYKPSTDSWSLPGNAASMTLARYNAAIATLDANRVMLYGGNNNNGNVGSAEIYNGATNTWSFTPDPLPAGYSAYGGSGNSSYAFHGAGKMLSATDGGLYLYDPAATSLPFTSLDTYNQGFYSMGSRANAVSAGSKVLLVPVQPQGANSGVQTECRLFDFGGKGSVCSATAECQSGLVCSETDAVDGVRVCCNSACSAPCNSCRATHKVSGTDGTCGARKTTEQVYSGCTSSDSSTCGNYNYTCDGLGACSKWPNTTICGDGSCKDGDTQNNQRHCDGAGTCVAQTSTDCSAGYQCTANAGNQCLSYCYNDADYCTANYYCQTWSDNGDSTNLYKCLAKKDQGSACSGNSPGECNSGHCVDGFCCDVACDGLCEACSSSLTGQSNGTCKPILANTVSGECSDNSAANCGTNGKCNGAGACQLYAAGTTCLGASCATPTSRNIVDTCDGSGNCVDKGTQNCATGYSCLSGVCQTSCTDDTQCASAYHCDLVAKQCVADKTQGQACPRDAACTGNANCVDGVCCESACGGTCRSCLKNRTGLASDGLCGNTLDDTDPENECTQGALYPNSCAAPGLCNGAGACRPYAKVDVECDSDSCTVSTLKTYGCNGAGTCKEKSTQCYPFTCNPGGTACRGACTVGTQQQDCVEGSFCQNGTCVGQKTDGSACMDNSECKSQHCANVGIGALEGDPEPDPGAGGAGEEPADHPGVCCDTACGSACEACKKSVKGQGSDGTCGPIKDHTDPKNDCPIDPLQPCGLSGECDGKKACRNVPSGTSCGATTCVGNSVQGQRCDGVGACVDNDGTTACAPYVCRDVNGAEQCTNPCAADDDCQDGYYCVEQSCKKKLSNGATCDTSGICSSGFCVDGLCCDTSCNGQCAACDNPGSEGICSAAKGEPHGNRTKCDHAGEECGGACDGVNAAACKYVASGSTCGTTTCDNGIAKSSECNGQGECRSNKNVECSPYVCGSDDACLERCEQDADCSQGYACDETTQRCLPAAVAAECSEDRQASVGQNGISTPCKPFLCVPASGTCAVSCAFTTDCAPDFVCEASTKTCLPTPPASEVEDESCACRAAGAAPTRHGYLALALFGLALGGLRRRKRSRNRPARSAKPAGLAQGPYPFE
jgi:MYXO-CTERM domain-containing protein